MLQKNMATRYSNLTASNVLYILPGRYSVCGEGIWSSLSVSMHMYMKGLARHACRVEYLWTVAMYQQ